jgi:U32 family peptidase
MIKKQKQIGEIIHYFNKIKVAVIKLSDKLEIGQEIRIIGGENDFNQEIKSMEIDQKKIKKAKKGDSVGVKVKEKVRQGYKVFKA